MLCITAQVTDLKVHESDALILKQACASLCSKVPGMSLDFIASEMPPEIGKDGKLIQWNRERLDNLFRGRIDMTHQRRAAVLAAIEKLDDAQMDYVWAMKMLLGIRKKASQMNIWDLMSKIQNSKFVMWI